jgi:hypothetical protein
MPTDAEIQYTVRGVSPEVDAALRRRARQRGISLNQLLVEELSASEGAGPKRHRQLSSLPGRWHNDAKFDRIVLLGHARRPFREDSASRSDLTNHALDFCPPPHMLIHAGI